MPWKEVYAHRGRYDTRCEGFISSFSPYLHQHSSLFHIASVICTLKQQTGLIIVASRHQPVKLCGTLQVESTYHSSVSCHSELFNSKIPSRTSADEPGAGCPSLVVTTDEKEQDRHPNVRRHPGQARHSWTSFLSCLAMDHLSLSNTKGQIYWCWLWYWEPHDSNIGIHFTQ